MSSTQLIRHYPLAEVGPWHIAPDSSSSTVHALVLQNHWVTGQTLANLIGALPKEIAILVGSDRQPEKSEDWREPLKKLPHRIALIDGAPGSEKGKWMRDSMLFTEGQEGIQMPGEKNRLSSDPIMGFLGLATSLAPTWLGPGDIVCNDSLIFVGSETVVKAAEVGISELGVVHEIRNIYGNRPVIIVTDPCNYDLDMWLRPGVGNTLLVPSAQTALMHLSEGNWELLFLESGEFHDDPFSFIALDGGGNLADRIEPQFDKIASELEELGFTVIRYPMLYDVSGRIEGSNRIRTMPTTLYGNSVPVGNHELLFPISPHEKFNELAGAAFEKAGYKLRCARVPALANLFGGPRCISQVCASITPEAATAWRAVIESKFSQT